MCSIEQFETENNRDKCQFITSIEKEEFDEFVSKIEERFERGNNGDIFFANVCHLWEAILRKYMEASNWYDPKNKMFMMIEDETNAWHSRFKKLDVIVKKIMAEMNPENE